MKIAILGAGSWGTALAKVFADASFDVSLYGRQETDFNLSHINRKYFPGVVLSSKIIYTTDLKEALHDASYVLFSLPSIQYRAMAKSIAPLLEDKVTLISTAKGFDPLTFERLSCVLREEIPSEKRHPIVSLLGPSFASEVMEGKVTGLSAVSQDLNTAKDVQQRISSSCFRVYTNDDEVGAECAAALKNVIAIASGALYGLGQGENAKAMLVTRGLSEMIRFGMALGGRRETFYGLCGVGDLLLTCSSQLSRNYSLGYQIGLYDDAKKGREGNHKTVEGVTTSQYALALATSKGIEMPITQAIVSCLFSDVPPSVALNLAMNRKLKSEL